MKLKHKNKNNKTINIYVNGFDVILLSEGNWKNGKPVKHNFTELEAIAVLTRQTDDDRGMSKRGENTRAHVGLHSRPCLAFCIFRFQQVIFHICFCVYKQIQVRQTCIGQGFAVNLLFVHSCSSSARCTLAHIAFMYN
jgi:hypothetical protein